MGPLGVYYVTCSRSRLLQIAPRVARRGLKVEEGTNTYGGDTCWGTRRSHNQRDVGCCTKQRSKNVHRKATGNYLGGGLTLGTSDRRRASDPRAYAAGPFTNPIHSCRVTSRGNDADLLQLRTELAANP